MKLIKITDDHYVVVYDSEIKEGEYVADFRLDKRILISKWNEEDSEDGFFFDAKKITHSTQPLDKSLFFTDKVWGCERLSLGGVKELIGEVEVEKKVKEYYEKDTTLNNPSSFKAGYNQALEDNKEKKYTEEDMLNIRNQLVNILPVGDVTAWDMIQAVSKYTKWFDKYIESLQSKTEWEVQIVDGKLKLV